ncbi:uncharacterized protein V1516DRAFT_580578 [Lipomyces oligophaga]|uniref:uncharacterized protein n=1 Tax=Lipomyces oligophaga TaxID=45792 RepID=UPI0034CD210F
MLAHQQAPEISGNSKILSSPSPSTTRTSTITTKTTATATYAFISHSPSTYPHCEPEIDNAPLARRKRRRTSPNELQILYSEFRLCAKPPRHVRQQIAERVGMTEKAVQIWFQNRRQSSRRAQQHEQKSMRSITEDESEVDETNASTPARPSLSVLLTPAPHDGFSGMLKARKTVSTPELNASNNGLASMTVTHSGGSDISLSSSSSNSISTTSSKSTLMSLYSGSSSPGPDESPTSLPPLKFPSLKSANSDSIPPISSLTVAATAAMTTAGSSTSSTSPVPPTPTPVGIAMPSVTAGSSPLASKYKPLTKGVLTSVSASSTNVMSMAAIVSPPCDQDSFPAEKCFSSPPSSRLAILPNLPLPAHFQPRYVLPTLQSFVFRESTSPTNISPGSTSSASTSVSSGLRLTMSEDGKAKVEIETHNHSVVNHEENKENGPKNMTLPPLSSVPRTHARGPEQSVKEFECVQNLLQLRSGTWA